MRMSLPCNGCGRMTPNEGPETWCLACEKAATAMQESKPTERDFTEDAGHENGRYQNICCHCGEMFIGHKRRVACKVCQEPKPTEREPVDIAGLLAKAERLKSECFDDGSHLILDMDWDRLIEDIVYALPAILDELGRWRTTVGRDIVTEAYEGVLSRAEAAEAAIDQLHEKHQQWSRREVDLNQINRSRLDRIAELEERAEAAEARVKELGEVHLKRQDILRDDYEDANIQQALRMQKTEAERDALKAKLAEVRDWAEEDISHEEDYFGFLDAQRDVLAILDAQPARATADEADRAEKEPLAERERENQNR